MIFLKKTVSVGHADKPVLSLWRSPSDSLGVSWINSIAGIVVSNSCFLGIGSPLVSILLFFWPSSQHFDSACIFWRKRKYVLVPTRLLRTPFLFTHSLSIRLWVICLIQFPIPIALQENKNNSDRMNPFLSFATSTQGGLTECYTVNGIIIYAV